MTTPQQTITQPHDTTPHTLTVHRTRVNTSPRLAAAAGLALALVACEHVDQPNTPAAGAARELASTTTDTEVLASTSATSFSAYSFKANHKARAACIGRFRNVGYDDVVYLHDDGLVEYLQSNGDGTFDEDNIQKLASKPGESVDAVDLTGNGLDDLVVVTEFNAGFYAMIADGKGNFIASTVNAVTKPVSSDVVDSVPAVALGDFNGDGKTDVTLAYSRTKTTWSGTGKEGTKATVTSQAMYSVFLGKGDGTFDQLGSEGGENAPTNQMSNAIDTYATSGDFDGDGKLDMGLGFHYMLNPGGSENSALVMFGNGDGTFGKDAETDITNVIGVDGVSSRAMGLSSGPPDVFAIATKHHLEFSQYENGAWTDWEHIAPANPGPMGAWDDFDGDGIIDVLVLDKDSSAVLMGIDWGPNEDPDAPRMATLHIDGGTDSGSLVPNGLPSIVGVHGDYLRVYFNEMK